MMRCLRTLPFLALFAVFCNGFASAQNLPQIYAPVYGNWCGPNHPVNMSRAAPPVDPLDSACMRHDQCIVARGQHDCGCDISFLNELRQTAWPNPVIGTSARAIYDAIAVIPCTSPEGTVQKKTMFAFDLAADVLGRGGDPMDVWYRWRDTFLRTYR